MQVQRAREEGNTLVCETSVIWHWYQDKLIHMCMYGHLMYDNLTHYLRSLLHT